MQRNASVLHGEWESERKENKKQEEADKAAKMQLHVKLNNMCKAVTVLDFFWFFLESC